MEKENQKQEHRKLILDGNAFYEIDLDCIACKEKEQKKTESHFEKRQRI